MKDRHIIIGTIIFALLLGICAKVNIDADNRGKLREQVRAEEIVLISCGDKHLEAFRHFYGDLNGREQRPIADSWAIRCPKLVNFELITPKQEHVHD